MGKWQVVSRLLVGTVYMDNLFFYFWMDGYCFVLLLFTHTYNLVVVLVCSLDLGVLIVLNSMECPNQELKSLTKLFLFPFLTKHNIHCPPKVPSHSKFYNFFTDIVKITATNQMKYNLLFRKISKNTLILYNITKYVIYKE